MENDTFDGIVAGFYRAATGAASWDQALDPVQQAFGARAVLLHTLDLATGQLLSLRSGGPDLTEAVFNYVRSYHQIDPRRNHALQLGEEAIGRWHHDHEIFGPEFVAKDRFFQHYLPAYETRFNSNVLIGLGGSIATGLVFELPAARGVLSADEREIARRLGDHMRDALHAYERMRRMAAQALAGHSLLGTFPYPMWLIDAERFIAYENEAARAEVATERRVARTNDRLVLTRGTGDRRLTDQLHRLYRSAHGTSALVDLRAGPGDAPTWMHLSLLVPGAVLGAFGEQPQVLATLFDPALVNALDPFALSNLFEFTPTEAKVAARMADGLTAVQISQAHGTSVNTVRTQIRQVISKLGSDRAVDVVRLLRQGEALWSSGRCSGV